jgi:serine phosphatase RsbU (regulator of sigma subunit)
VVRADGSAAAHGTSGSLIGVFDDIDLTTTTLDLHPGDAVVLYTDGATDVAPPHGLSEREFTDLVRQACQDAPSATLIADRVHLALSSILSIDERNDDIALLVLKLRSAA